MTGTTPEDRAPEDRAPQDLTSQDPAGGDLAAGPAPSTALPPGTAAITLTVDGADVTADDAEATLLDVLRDQLGITSVKDGCAPQGQCGCCTVLVDGAPRVACVTPVRRVRGRSVTTVDALDDASAWADAFCATGASQCGFCTPGIIVRLAGLAARSPDAGHAAVEQALLAHLCRCTGWRTILDAWDARHAGGTSPGRDLDAAAARATLEGHTPQRLDAAVSLGRGGFADDRAPTESLVAVLDGPGTWTLGESVAAARVAAGRVQGRRTTEETGPPIALPEGDWAVVLQTSWVEPAYLETDASWAEPGGEPADPLANGGAFGAKHPSPVAAAAATLAAEHQRPVRALYRREDTVRFGPKRPPLAAGLAADGTGIVRVAATEGIAAAINAVLPEVVVEEVAVPGPPTSVSIRAAGWAEATVLAAALQPEPCDPEPRDPEPGDPEPLDPEPPHPETRWTGPVSAPESAGPSGRAWARVDADGIHVRVDAGDPLDEVALVSYCVGAAHQAASWVTSESLTVDVHGAVHDLTIRSFGILRAVDTPPVHVEIVERDGPAVAVSDAVFAAVAAATWRFQGRPPVWPTAVPLRP